MENAVPTPDLVALPGKSPCAKEHSWFCEGGGRFRMHAKHVTLDAESRLSAERCAEPSNHMLYVANHQRTRDNNERRTHGVVFVLVQAGYVPTVEQERGEVRKPTTPSSLDAGAEVAAGPEVPSAGVDEGTGTGESVPTAASLRGRRGLEFCEVVVHVPDYHLTDIIQSLNPIALQRCTREGQGVAAALGETYTHTQI